MVSEADFPMHAVTQRPMAMYHSWGSQNAWLRQILGRNWLYMARERAAKLGIADGDWVTVTSHHGKIKAQAKLMDGVNPDTVWTWNAIGKRSGAWGLAPDAPEAKKGFLLNHLISELLPEREGGYRYSNSDPVTGQAAWYDLRVRVEKAADQEPDERAAVRHAEDAGEGEMTSLPPPAAKKLGLVIDLDTCVGCQACATSCKEWNTQGYSAPLTDDEPLWRRSRPASGSTASTAMR